MATETAAPVLVVDDDWQTRRLIRWALEEEGFVVETAADGGQALQLARRRRPALVVLDMRLPVLDGTAVAGGLRAAHGARAADRPHHGRRPSRGAGARGGRLRAPAEALRPGRPYRHRPARIGRAAGLGVRRAPLTGGGLWRGGGGARPMPAGVEAKRAELLVELTPPAAAGGS